MKKRKKAAWIMFTDNDEIIVIEKKGLGKMFWETEWIVDYCGNAFRVLPQKFNKRERDIFPFLLDENRIMH